MVQLVNLILSSSYTLIQVASGQTETYKIDLGQIIQVDSELEIKVGAWANAQIRLIGFGEICKNLKLKFNLLGNGANLTLNGALFLIGKSQVMINIQQNHWFVNTTSLVKIRTALDDQSQFHYQGLIWVGPSAANTIAHQENKNLLLSSTAQASSVPNLEILNPDVQCGHGSAIGPISPDQMVYLQSRGLNFLESQNLLVQSFLSEALPDKIDLIKLGLEKL